MMLLALHSRWRSFDITRWKGIAGVMAEQIHAYKEGGGI